MMAARFEGEWMTADLAAIADIRNGATPRTGVPGYWHGPIPWCIPTDITGSPGKYLVATARSITPEGLASCGASLLPPGALLICTRATIGELKITAMPVATNQGFKSLVCGDFVDHEYLYYSILTARNHLIDVATGSTFLEVSKHDLGNIRVPLPPLPEQRAIAAVLSGVDKLIGSVEALIVKKRAIKRAAMQELLTGRTRLPGFEGKWETKRLDEVAAVTMGQSPPSASYNLVGNGLPLIQGNADISRRSTIDRIWTTLPSKRCGAGDIVLTVRAPVGSVARASKRACLGRGVCGLKPLDHGPFLYYALILRESHWEDVEQGSPFSAANSAQVAGFPIAAPIDKLEQRAIATVLSDMDAEIAALDHRLDKTRAIKQGMMQQLFTGSIRLPIPDDHTEDDDSHDA